METQRFSTLKSHDRTLSLSQLNALARNPASHAGRTVQVSVLGDCSTQWLVTALRGYGRALGLELNITEAGFDQIDGQIFNPGSELYTSHPDYIILLETSRRLLEKFRALEPAARSDFHQRRASLNHQRLEVLRSSTAANVLWFDVEELKVGVHGGFAANNPLSFEAQLMHYRAGLWQLCSQTEGVYLFPFAQLAARHGEQAVFDPRLFTMAESPFALDFVPELARKLGEMMAALEGVFKKCLVLDLDNTLWGGVVGEVGPHNVVLGSLGVGRAFVEFQSWLRELKNRGVVLAVCSKNELESARAPFLENPEMRLKLEDITIFLANWKPKYENILEIAQMLNLGLDSLVFLDDNPMERDSVREFLPQVTVPELPTEPEDYVTYLSHLDLFQAPQFTREDADRTELYRKEMERRDLRERSASFEDYLKSLEMQADFQPVDDATRARAAQLFARSNQFNTRNVRYSESELLELGRAPENYAVYSCRLRDRFGDHGIISVVVLALSRETGEAFIENWVMSCRVFNRQVEHFLRDKMIELCRGEGLRRLIGERLPTKKNVVIEELFSKLGFALREDRWELRFETAQALPHTIQEVAVR